VLVAPICDVVAFAIYVFFYLYKLIACSMLACILVPIRLLYILMWRSDTDVKAKSLVFILSIVDKGYCTVSWCIRAVCRCYFVFISVGCAYRIWMLIWSTVYNAIILLDDQCTRGLFDVVRLLLIQ